MTVKIKRREPPAGWSTAFRDNACGASESASTPRLNPRQEIADLTGASELMAWWFQRLLDRIELASDVVNGDIAELFEIPRDIAAWRRAVIAFHEWRAAS